MSESTKKILLWVVIIVGIFGLLYFLAKIGSGGQPVKEKKLSLAVDDKDQLKGKQDTKITMVEYSDFECPYCGQIVPLMKQLINEYPNDLKIVFRHFPLNIHKNSKLSAQAAEAAGKQGKFWEMHDVLFNTVNQWNDQQDPSDFFISLANSIGLNKDQFKNDFNSDSVKDKVERDLNSALDSGLNSTPSFFVNGAYVETPGSYEEFKALIENELKK